MRKAVLIVSCLIFFLLASSFPGTVLSNEVTMNDDTVIDASQRDPWWKHWSGDRDQNGIDDLIEEKIVANSQERVPIFIKYERELTQNDAERLLQFDLEIGYIFEFIDTISARNVDLKDIQKLRKLPGVGMIELQLPIEPQLFISNPAIKARNSTEYSPDTAWALGYTGKGVNIAIIDTGVDDYHESLMGRFVAGVSFGHPLTPRDGSFNPDDEFGHGTYCAGIALGTGGTTDLNLDGEPDYMGVAPDAGLIDVQPYQGLVGQADALVASIQWVIYNKDTDWPDQPDEYDGIDVISLSIGLGASEAEAAIEAVEAGLVVVLAAGNDGPNNPPPGVTEWPDGVIVVGATDDNNTITRDDDVIADMSSRGPRADGALKPDVCAPGMDIMAPTRDSFKRYGLPTAVPESGTSFSAPHVAGVVALMLEAVPNLTPEQVMEILHDSAEARGDPYDPQLSDKYNTAYGWGIVDAYEAVRLAQQEDDDPPEISDIEVVDVSATTATITWLTNKPSNSIIQYGITTGLGLEKSDLNTYEVSHSMTLDGLISDTDYYFNIQGSDEYGHGPGESGIQAPFHTDIMPDIIPPEIIEGPIVLGIPSDTSVTVYWKTDEISDSVVEYGLDQNYGDSESDITDVFDHYITLTGLTPATTYHYRAQSTDPSGNPKNSTDFTFITATEPDNTPPVITSGPDVINTTYNNATIHWQTDEASTTLVRYGETTSYGKEVGDSAYVLVHQIKLTGLSSSTSYYYQIESTDSSDNIRKFNDESTIFTTDGPPDTTPPIITDGPMAISVTDTEATIRWVTNEKSDSLVQYGLTKSYGSKEPKTPTGGYVLDHEITLSNLWPSTTYHYKVISEDKSGNYGESDDHTFTTASPPDVTPPEILVGPNLLVVGEHTATIIWTTYEESDSVLYYGTTLNYGSTASDPSHVLEHQIVLTDLSPSTTYHYKVRSSDESGNYDESDDNTFTTLQISIPIEIEFLDFVDGQTIKEVTVIEFSVTGGTGLVDWARFKVDNGSWENLGEGPTFEIQIDPKDHSSGEHTLYVEVSDGSTSMQEDLTFIVEHPTEEGEEIWLWILAIVIAATIILVLAAAAYYSSTKRKTPRTAFSDIDIEPGPVFSPVSFTPDEPVGIDFIPDEPAEEPEAEIAFVPEEPRDEEPGVSFIPETTTLSEEPGISFIPDREPVSFNILEEEEPRFPVFDKIRCPRCKSMFEADISSNIICPDCGFSAELER